MWYINLYVLCETNPIMGSKPLMDIFLGVRKILHGWGRVPEWWPEPVCKFLWYREVWYINLYVLCEKNLMVWSKSLTDIILGIRKILHGSGSVFEKLPDLLLTIFEQHKGVIYQFKCTLQDKSNSVITITYGYHPWNQEDPLWIRKDSWNMTRSRFDNFWGT